MCPGFDSRTRRLLREVFLRVLQITNIFLNYCQALNHEPLSRVNGQALPVFDFKFPFSIFLVLLRLILIVGMCMLMFIVVLRLRSMHAHSNPRVRAGAGVRAHPRACARPGLRTCSFSSPCSYSSSRELVLVLVPVLVISLVCLLVLVLFVTRCRPFTTIIFYPIYQNLLQTFYLAHKQEIFFPCYVRVIDWRHSLKSVSMRKEPGRR